MDLELDGKTAIVTGAAQGIGRAVAEALAGEGVQLALFDVDQARLREAAAACEARGVQALEQVVDVTHREQVHAAVEAVLAAFGRIDILVNNAGIASYEPFTEVAEETWDRILAVNLKGAFLVSQAVLPVMQRQRSGVILTMSSLAGKVGGLAVSAPYSASKAALLCLTKSLAREGAPFGVRANSLAPAFIATRLMPEEKHAELARLNPLGRMGQPEDVAGAVCFLASDRAGFITGATLDINGGAWMD